MKRDAPATHSRTHAQSTQALSGQKKTSHLMTRTRDFLLQVFMHVGFCNTAWKWKWKLPMYFPEEHSMVWTAEQAEGRMSPVLKLILHY